MNTILPAPPDLFAIPDHVTEYLDPAYGRPSCIKFNRYGNLLAIGTRSQLVLWDVDTKSVAATCGSEHLPVGHGIKSVAFPAPRTGVTVMAVHEHGLLRVWDTLARKVMCEVMFDVPLLCAEPHPKDASLVIVVPDQGPPVLVQLHMGCYSCDYSSMKFDTVPREDYRGALDSATVSKIRKASNLPEPPKLGKQHYKLKNHKFVSEVASKSARHEKEQYVVRWTHDGKYVIRGSMRTGVVDTFLLDKESVTMKRHGSWILGNHELIRDIVLTVSGDKMLIHTNRELRVVPTWAVLELEARGKAGTPPLLPVDVQTTFKDRVNNWKWNCSSISRNGDIISACVSAAEHKICIWDGNTAQILCCLEGPIESVDTIVWHPRRSGFASIGKNTGTVYFWDRNVSENWSAFAPDFVELEANEEYEERESEFDLPDESDELAQKNAREEKEKDNVVDILGDDCKDTKVPGAETDDENAPFFFIPAKPTSEYSQGNKRKQGPSKSSAEDEEDVTQNGKTSRKRLRSENGSPTKPNGVSMGNGHAPNGTEKHFR